MHEFSDDKPVEPFDFGDELPGGVKAYEAGAICPDDTALHIPAHSALSVADGAINYGGLGFVPEEHLGDDVEATKGRSASRTPGSRGARVRQPTRRPRRAGRGRREGEAAEFARGLAPVGGHCRADAVRTGAARWKTSVLNSIAGSPSHPTAISPPGRRCARALREPPPRAACCRAGRPRPPRARDRAHDCLAVPLADTAHARGGVDAGPGSGESPTCPYACPRCRRSTFPRRDALRRRAPRSRPRRRPTATWTRCCSVMCHPGSTRSSPRVRPLRRPPPPQHVRRASITMPRHHRVAMPRTRPHRPCGGSPAHDPRVVLGLAQFVQHRAAARVEERVVLERTAAACTASSAVPPASSTSQPAAAAVRSPSW